MFKNSRLYKFLEGVKLEFYKIVWPSKKEFYSSFLVVIFAVILVSTVCIIIDYMLHSIVQLIINM